MNRQEIESESIRLMSLHKNMLYTWATGCGKTKQAINKISSLSQGKALICTAEVAHINNWRREFQKWGFNKPLVEVEVICYASLKKYRNTSWDVLVLDECHHIATDIRVDCLETIKADSVIALSATVNNETKYALKELFGDFYEFNITLRQAIDWDILPKPRINVIPLRLNLSGNDQTYVVTRGNSKKRKKFICESKDRWEYIKDKTKYPDLELTVKCSEWAKYAYLCERFEYLKKRYIATRNEAVKNMWLHCGSERKRFLAERKTKYAKVIIDRFLKDCRHIVFCGDILQADTLGGTNAIHSKKDAPQSLINDFNKGKTNSLYAVGMLQEGQNLPDIEKGMIIQLDGNERGFCQKLGRILRSEEPEIYILYFRQTRDEEYLKKALEGIDREYINEMDYDEICDRH